jgi:hypothetical protein
MPALMPRALAMLVGVVAATTLLACSRPLPEEGSPQATLYRERCGTGCHGAFQPHTLTPKMWKVQVDRMDQKFRGAGLPVPSGAERDQLLDYLTRNAGG